MSTLTIEGSNSLVGDVTISGSKISASVLIPAALFSNEDIILENVPKIQDINTQIEIVKSLGGVCEWVGRNNLLINASKIESFEIPGDLAVTCRSSALFAAPILFRFGKAILPKPGGCAIGPRPINRWLETWDNMGYEVLEDPNYLVIRSGGLTNTTIDFKVSTHTGTANAILSALFVPGETTILNAAEEPEIDDLITLCQIMGSNVRRTDPRTIKLEGRNVFKGGTVTVQPDRDEVVTFATAAIVTSGNITIKNVNREHILSFVNVLSKMGCKYEFSGNEMRAWSTGEKLISVDVTTAPAPGFMSNWQPFVVLLETKCTGDSRVHETIFTNRFSYVRDLNRMGAKIQLVNPSELGIKTVISDDMYDKTKLGEPLTVAAIHGPTKLKGISMAAQDIRSGAAMILAALSAEGKSTITDTGVLNRGYEGFLTKLGNLGAVIDEE